MINIVMVAKDRERLTTQALDSLRDHTQDYTLTLVDDGSKEPWELPYGTTLRVTGSQHVLGKLKNLGVYWSQHHFGRGEWLYLSDNDVYFTQGWLDRLLLVANAFEDFLIIGGQNHPYHQHIFSAHMMCGLREYVALAGTSWLMRWETWDRYGPLVETGAPGVGQSEDHEFCQRIRADGYKVGAVWPHVVLDTGIRQTDGKLSPGHEAKQQVQGVYYET